MGCGAWIKLSGHERIHMHWNGGLGSNNKAELMALWGGLFAAVNMELSEIHIYSDSAMIIGCIMGIIHEGTCLRYGPLFLVMGL